MQTSQLKTAEVYSFVPEQVWIRCESGQLWISHDGEDIVLARGEKFFAHSNDRVVVEALQDSHFTTFKSAIAQSLPAKESNSFSQLATAH